CRAERIRCLGLAAFLVSVAGLAFLIGWGRGGLGVHCGFCLRYVTLAVPAICCIYFAAGVCGSVTVSRVVQTALFMLLALLLPENRRYGISYAEQRRPLFEAVKRDVHAGRAPEEIAHNHPFLYPLLEPLADRLEKLRRAGIASFPRMAPSSRGHSAAGSRGSGPLTVTSRYRASP